MRRITLLFAPVLVTVGVLVTSLSSPDDTARQLAVPEVVLTTPTTTSPDLVTAGTTPTTPPPVTASPGSVPVVNPAASTPTSRALALTSDTGAQALGLIGYPIDRTGYRVVFSGPRRGILGLTEPEARTITIYVRPSQRPVDVARVLAHELGHVVDMAFTDDAERGSYRTVRGLDGRSWYPDCDACTDDSSPAGDFAEVFAWWLLGPGRFDSTLAAAPTDEQLRQLAPIFTAPASSTPLRLAPTSWASRR